MSPIAMLTSSRTNLIGQSLDLQRDGAGAAAERGMHVGWHGTQRRPGHNNESSLDPISKLDKHFALWRGVWHVHAGGCRVGALLKIVECLQRLGGDGRRHTLKNRDFNVNNANTLAF